MARNQEQSAAVTETEVVAAASTTEGETAVAEKASRPKIVLTLDEEAAKDFGGDVGQQVARKDYILKRFAEKGAARGAIAKELTRLEGRNVPYQIVFQATKGVAQPKVEAAPEATTAAEASAS